MASLLVDYIIKEIFIRYGVLIKIILDRDLRFIVVF